MVPDVGCNSPHKLRSKVVFPFPFSPTKPIISPVLMSKFIGPNPKEALYLFYLQKAKFD